MMAVKASVSSMSFQTNGFSSLSIPYGCQLSAISLTTYVVAINPVFTTEIMNWTY
jgi:hypothetical protein